MPDPPVAGRAALPRLLEPLRATEKSGERRLVIENEHVLVVRKPRSKGVVLFLEPNKLGFQVANTLLETAHFRDHTRIGTADVTE